MTFTFTRVGKKEAISTRMRVIGDLAISSYTAGGEPITAANVGLKTLESINFHGGGTKAIVWSWDATNGLVLASRGAGAAKVSDLYPGIKDGLDANLSDTTVGNHYGYQGVMNLADANATTTGNLASTGGKTSGLTNPDYPRNVYITLHNASGSVTYTAGYVRITGTDQFDVAQTEDIAIPAGAVGATAYNSFIGYKPFKTVTKVDVLANDKTKTSAAQPANAQISVGFGSVVGLRRKLFSGSSVNVVSMSAITSTVLNALGKLSSATTGYTVNPVGVRFTTKDDGTTALAATSGSTTTLVDSGTTFDFGARGCAVGDTITITGGTGVGQTMTVTAVAVHTLTFATATTAPDSTSTYTVTCVNPHSVKIGANVDGVTNVGTSNADKSSVLIEYTDTFTDIVSASDLGSVRVECLGK